MIYSRCLRNFSLELEILLDNTLANNVSLIKTIMNTINQQSNKPNNTNAAARRPFDRSDNNWRGYEYLWAVYPDYWAPTWGPKPLLGYVRADSPFNARYAAFDKGLLPRNDTFEPEVVLQDRRYIRR